MITLAELDKLSSDKFEDAKVLYQAGRFDGAFYICGYALELMLKKRICETLGWQGYPNTKNEFDKLTSFKTHNLGLLLHLSGVEGRIKNQFLIEWSIVNAWDPEIRYSSVQQNAKDTKLMLDKAEILLKNL